MTLKFGSIAKNHSHDHIQFLQSDKKAPADAGAFTVLIIELQR
jgi:hypothetical protein